MTVNGAELADLQTQPVSVDVLVHMLKVLSPRLPPVPRDFFPAVVAHPERPAALDIEDVYE